MKVYLDNTANIMDEGIHCLVEKLEIIETKIFISQPLHTMKKIFFTIFLVIISISVFAQTQLPSWCIGGFTRPEGLNPIFSPDSATFFDPMSNKKIAWRIGDVFNPAATTKDGKIYVLYRAEDKSGMGIGMRTSRIGLAFSTDGLHFVNTPHPVLFPANDDQKENEWRGGCEDPRVAMTENGTYVMLYTQWNRKTPRIGVATSKDLLHWKKHGPAFQKAYNGKFSDMATKSASIITTLKNDKLVMVKINGKYWMYWGEEHVYAATSTDLINWQPLIEPDGNLKQLISPRKGYFDSRLTECGPPAVLTKNGIVLLYNGKNADNEDADKNYTLNSYCAGQVMFDKNDPTKPIERLSKPFLVPEADFEKSGQYPAGTVFIEGLVYFKKKWFLYYGCADSRVAVAVCDLQNKK
ncbi:MAG: glycoside hydrolase family 130 protein [Chitinophagaceae bacterium]|jgi:predicted GH43/DUF377 family glycosyl hydrolase|nr:glycoside hydrolase family 130 protein [Chitinophagaceae bacterium]